MDDAIRRADSLELSSSTDCLHAAISVRSDIGSSDRTSGELATVYANVSSKQVHVWAIDLSNDWHSSMSQRIGMLSEDELERAKSFRFSQDRDSFVVRRSALREILSKYDGRDPEQLAFVVGNFGKPSLALPSHSFDERSRDPCQGHVWSGGFARKIGAAKEFDCYSHASGVEFSTSSSRDLALVAVTRDRAIGIDVEYRDDSIDVQTIADRFFTDEERLAVDQVADVRKSKNNVQREQREQFFRLWTRKEAFAKATGLGLPRTLDFDRTSDSSRDDNCTDVGDRGREWHFEELLTRNDNYAIAVWVSSPLPSFEAFCLSP